MTTGTDAFLLIRTKLQRPSLPGDLIPRRRLLDRLHAGSDRKLTLISAMAGTGKTTLLAQWLTDAECPLPSAWLSLDEHDNDVIVFVSYLIGAARTVFPSACEKTLELLGAAQTPTLRVITTSLVNELDEACRAHVPEMRRLFRVSRVDFWIASAAILGVLSAGGRDDRDSAIDPVAHLHLDDSAHAGARPGTRNAGIQGCGRSS